MIHKLITVLMDFVQSDWKLADDEGSDGATVKLDVDAILQCNTSANLPPVLTENG